MVISKEKLQFYAAIHIISTWWQRGHENTALRHIADV